MYKERTQSYDPEIHEEYVMIHPSSCHVIYNHDIVHIGLLYHSYKHKLKKQQFSALIVSLKSGF